jgi:flagellar protein FlaF
MDQKQNALRGYGQTKRQTASDKHIELQLFSSITARLRAQNSAPNPQETKHLNADMAQALLDNAKLWNILFCDLVTEQNKLPIETKKNLISLAEFTQQHTKRVLSGQAAPGILIEINDSVILGLKASLMAAKASQNTMQEVA